MSEKTFELRVDLTGHDETSREKLRISLRGSGFLQFAESCPDYQEHNPDYAVDGELPLQDMSVLSVYSFVPEELEKAKTIAEGAGEFRCEISAMETTVWQEGWKESFKPLSVGKFFVKAPWHEIESPKDAFAICIDPGMAFGTGQHATTHVCLKLMSILSQKDFDGPVLDCGSGSGILSVAACRLGAEDITATDIEADAIKAIEENCARNAVQGVKLSQQSVPSGSYGLVMANILTPVLLELLPQFVASLSDSGKILFSGILVEQKNDFLVEAKKHGLHPLDETSKDGWLGLVMEKQ